MSSFCVPKACPVLLFPTSTFTGYGTGFLFCRYTQFQCAGGYRGLFPEREARNSIFLSFQLAARQFLDIKLGGKYGGAGEQVPRNRIAVKISKGYVGMHGYVIILQGYITQAGSYLKPLVQADGFLVLLIFLVIITHFCAFNGPDNLEYSEPYFSSAQNFSTAESRSSPVRNLPMNFLPVFTSTCISSSKTKKQ